MRLIALMSVFVKIVIKQQDKIMVLLRLLVVRDNIFR